MPLKGSIWLMQTATMKDSNKLCLISAVSCRILLATFTCIGNRLNTQFFWFVSIACPTSLFPHQQPAAKLPWSSLKPEKYLPKSWAQQLFPCCLVRYCTKIAGNFYASSFWIQGGEHEFTRPCLIGSVFPKKIREQKPSARTIEWSQIAWIWRSPSVYWQSRFTDDWRSREWS